MVEGGKHRAFAANEGNACHRRARANARHKSQGVPRDLDFTECLWQTGAMHVIGLLQKKDNARNACHGASLAEEKQYRASLAEGG